MARDSRIEWTNHTFNPWWGCTKISAACDHCYAETWAKRVGFDIWSHGKPRRFLSESYWRQPYRWNEEARHCGSRARVFCASMADVFEWKRGLTPLRTRLWRLIEETPYLDWLLLTKRPHLVSRMTPWIDDWPTNVWLGTTVEDQRWAHKRIDHLGGIRAKIRFLSCEPLLGGVDLNMWLEGGIVDWVIAGGESGPNARPSDPSWFLALRDQCISYSVPFHFKQWGEWAPIGACSAMPRSIIDDGCYSTPLGRYGKKASGRTLGGRTWDGVPLHESNLDPLLLLEAASTEGPLHFDSPFCLQRS